MNEFLRGFILTTKGDLQAKIDYTFRLYDQNDDNQISGDEIKQMANVRHTPVVIHLQVFPSLVDHTDAGR